MDFTDIIKFFNGEICSIFFIGRVFNAFFKIIFLNGLSKLCNLLNMLKVTLASFFFFNRQEMAERHNAKAILKVARELVLQLQTLIDNK